MKLDTGRKRMEEGERKREKGILWKGQVEGERWREEAGEEKREEGRGGNREGMCREKDGRE